MRPGHRHDIQGLRAVAILLVLVYHLWPDALPGGFTGVDVFFVISGWLIVGSLVLEAGRTGRIDIAAFYLNRVRRILPAASVVLVLTALATAALLPVSRWQSIGQDLLWAGLQVQNWWLALSGSGYDDAGSAASPVQHFWSLGVEEQFYLLVAPLAAVAAWAAPRLARGSGMPDEAPRAPAGRLRLRYPGAAGTVLGLMVLLMTASFVWSVARTPTAPDAAYYSTFTRMWQLVLGGVAAVLARSFAPGPRVRRTLGLVGLALVAAAAVALSTDMPYPGWLALLPTMGTALLLVAGTHVDPRGTGPATGDGEDEDAADTRSFETVSDAVPASSLRTALRSLDVTRWLSVRPMTWIGDISYSLYLVHWPLIVIATYLLGGPLDLGTGLLCGALSIVLAAVLRHLVEEPFRLRLPFAAFGPALRRRVGRPVAMQAAMLVAVSVLAAATLPMAVDRQRAGTEDGSPVALPTSAATADPEGTAAPTEAELPPGTVLGPVGLPVAAEGTSLSPAIVDARTDRGPAWELGCLQFTPNVTPAADCVFGDPASTRLAYVVGDSHAAQWLPALDAWGAEQGWRIETRVANGCSFTLEPLLGEDGTTPHDYCVNGNQAVIRELEAAPPDLVITSALRPAGYQQVHGWTWPSEAAAQQGYADALQVVRDLGIPVAVIADQPSPKAESPVECVERFGAASARCTLPGDLVDAQTDPLLAAAVARDDVAIVDLNDQICTELGCTYVLGDVIVYRDDHLTATYTTAVADLFAAELEAGLDGAAAVAPTARPSPKETA